MPKVKEAAPEEVRAAYELHDQVESNPASRALFAANLPTLDDAQRRVVDDLEAEGYSVMPFAELFSAELWDQVAADAAIFTREMEAQLDGGSAPAKQPKPGKPGKPD